MAGYPTGGNPRRAKVTLVLNWKRFDIEAPLDPYELFAFVRGCDLAAMSSTRPAVGDMHAVSCWTSTLDSPVEMRLDLEVYEATPDDPPWNHLSLPTADMIREWALLPREVRRGHTFSDFQRISPSADAATTPLRECEREVLPWRITQSRARSSVDDVTGLMQSGVQVAAAHRPLNDFRASFSLSCDCECTVCRQDSVSSTSTCEYYCRDVCNQRCVAATLVEHDAQGTNHIVLCHSCFSTVSNDDLVPNAACGGLRTEEFTLVPGPGLLLDKGSIGTLHAANWAEIEEVATAVLRRIECVSTVISPDVIQEVSPLAGEERAYGGDCPFDCDPIPYSGSSSDSSWGSHGSGLARHFLRHPGAAERLASGSM